MNEVIALTMDKKDSQKVKLLALWVGEHFISFWMLWSNKILQFLSNYTFQILKW